MNALHPFRHLLIAGLLALPFAAIAQGDDLPEIPAERLQEIKAQKSAYLTQKMGLTPEEAQQFWPLYNEYDGKLEALRREMREVRQAARRHAGELTEEEARDLITVELDQRQRELDIRREYAEKFQRQIGSRKTAVLYKAEHDFNRELLRRFRERMEGRPGPPPGRR